VRAVVAVCLMSMWFAYVIFVLCVLGACCMCDGCDVCVLWVMCVVYVCCMYVICGLLCDVRCVLYVHGVCVWVACAVSCMRMLCGVYDMYVAYVRVCGMDIMWIM